jgi:membrane protein YdbS with pleckstrin-like domain
MPEWMKAPLLRLLRVPADPVPPAGAPGTLIVFRAAPGYFLYRVAAWSLRQVMTLVGIVVALFFLWGGARSESGAGLLFFGLELVAVAFVLLGIPFSLLLLRLDYEMRWYQVTDRSLRIREGVWAVREMTMTFANVQNIEVTQGPLQRLFGIADLRVQTAGGGGGAGQSSQQGQEGLGLNMHVGYFRGIADAQGVRDQVLQRLRRYRDTGLGDQDDAPALAPAAAVEAPPLAEAAAALAQEAAGLRQAAEALATRGG